MQQEKKALQPRQERARRIKKLKPAQNIVEDEVEGTAAAPSDPGSTKFTLLTSPHDVVIECKGEKIYAHSAVLRHSVYFATILDETDLGDNKIIALPDSFDPREVRQFVCALHNCLDVDTDQLERNISPTNVVSLTELAHYFDAPLLHTACDKVLASKYGEWFPGQLLLVTQFAITHHLPELRRECTQWIGYDIDNSGLLAHLDDGRGDLAKDTLLMTDLITRLKVHGSPRRLGPINTSPIFYETE
jgi:hypothetical protein